MCRAASLTESPAGISHCEFVLEHQSTQMEAGLPRKAYCRIQVVFSGEGSHQFTRELTLGVQVRATGFICRHQTRSGVGKLVLHAQQLELNF